MPCILRIRCLISVDLGNQSTTGSNMTDKCCVFCSSCYSISSCHPHSSPSQTWISICTKPFSRLNRAVHLCTIPHITTHNCFLVLPFPMLLWQVPNIAWSRPTEHQWSKDYSQFIAGAVQLTIGKCFLYHYATSHIIWRSSHFDMLSSPNWYWEETIILVYYSYTKIYCESCTAILKQ